MAVLGNRYSVNATTRFKVPFNDANNRPGMVLIIQNPHSENRHLLVGGADLNTTDKRGYEITPGDSLQITFPLRDDDDLYVLAESGTDLYFTVLSIGV